MRTIIFATTFLFCLSNVFGQTGNKKLKISHLTGGFYIYTTYNTYKGEQVSANGMYLVTSKQVVIFDTPWDTTQFQPLLDSIKVKHKKTATLCIATDFHSDRTAGLEYYKKKGIKTFTTIRIDQTSIKRGMKRAELIMENDTSFTVGQYSFQTYFPGEGHTADNIIIWFGKQKILYGGCLIKSMQDQDLGYLGDANVKKYAATVENVKKKCPAPKYVIPGHGDWSNVKALAHTLFMAQQLNK
ncbi:BlaB/IND/MUS family subclass B1 metallo-beta-lactamase [Dyadobacter subterraneus]